MGANDRSWNNKAQEEIKRQITEAKNEKDISRGIGYVKALYDYNHITYDQAQNLRRLLEKSEKN